MSDDYWLTAPPCDGCGCVDCPDCFGGGADPGGGVGLDPAREPGGRQAGRETDPAPRRRASDRAAGDQDAGRGSGDC